MMSPFIQFEIVLVLAITPNLQLKSEHFVSMLWDSVSYLNFLIYLALSDTVLLGNGAGNHPLTTQSRWKCRFSTHRWYLRGLVTLEKDLEARLPASLHWDQDDSGGVASLQQDGGIRPPLTQARRAWRVVAYYCKKNSGSTCGAHLTPWRWGILLLHGRDESSGNHLAFSDTTRMGKLGCLIIAWQGWRFRFPTCSLPIWVSETTLFSYGVWLECSNYFVKVFCLPRPFLVLWLHGALFFICTLWYCYVQFHQ